MGRCGARVVTAEDVVARVRARFEEGLRQAGRARAAIDGAPWPPPETPPAAEAPAGVRGAHGPSSGKPPRHRLRSEGTPLPHRSRRLCPPPRRPWAATALAAVLLLLLLASVAPAAPVDDLRAGDVAVEPGASLGADAARRLGEGAAALRARGYPTKFAVVAERPESAARLAEDLRTALAFEGALLVLSPSSLGIASPHGEGYERAAFARRRDLVRADRVAGLLALGDDLARPPTAGGGGDGGVPVGVLIVPLVLLGLVAVLFLLGPLAAILGLGGLAALLLRRGRRPEPPSASTSWSLEEERAALEPLVDALASRITELGPEVEAGGGARPADARAGYDAAVLAYGEVRDAMPRARTERALDEIRRRLQEGLRAAQDAQAAIAGRPAPSPAAPLLEGLCAFDPDHGRAVGESVITTPAGNRASVPVCARCRAALAHGRRPAPRTVPVHGVPRPYWQGAGLAGGFGLPLFPLVGGALGLMALHDLLGGGAAGADGGGGDAGGGDVGGGGDF